MRRGTVHFEVAARGGPRRIDVERGPAGLWVRSVIPGMDATPVRLEPLEGTEWWRLTVNSTTIPVRMRQADGAIHVIVGAERVAVTVRRALPVPSRRSATGAPGGSVEVRAPMPGLVVSLPLSAGQHVDQGSAVAVVEAMKMQMEVPAPTAGRVEEVRVRPGQEVAGQQILVVIRIVREGTT
jgi:biotin carboxyl carrier protein